MSHKDGYYVKKLKKRHAESSHKLPDLFKKLKQVLKTKEKFKTNVYRFKSKDGSFIHLRSICFSFRNPWTKEVEYIVSKNTVVPVQEVSSSGQSVDAGGVTMELNEDSVDDADVVESRQIEKHRLQIPGLPGGTRPGAGRIGRQIADEILELQKSHESPHAVADSTNHTPSQDQVGSSSADPNLCCHATADSTKYTTSLDQAKISVCRTSLPTASTSMPEADVSTNSSAAVPNGGILPTNRNGISVHVPTAAGILPTNRNGISVHVPAAASGSASAADTNLIENVMAEQSIIEEMNVSGNDGNDEAAMSIIMSLLEADAGLGGPIDFNDLPWPL